jgi:hypothetical protein
MSNITTDFITATKKIHADVRAVLTTLHLIREDVKLIREETIRETNDPSSTGQTSNSEQEPQQTAPSKSNALDTSKAKRDEHKNDGKQSNKFYRFLERWWKKLKKPRFQVEVIAIIGLGLYTCETRRTNNLTQKNLELARESIAAQIVLGDWDFADPVVSGKTIAAKVPLTNIGHSPAVYGIETIAFRWATMPNDIPIEAPSPNVVMEPSKPTMQTIFDTQTASEEFIYSIPHIRELTVNPATRHLEPPLPRPTLFFVGRLVYDSLGIRTEKHFCFFMVYADDLSTRITMPKTDSRFVLMNCPKWNTTIYTTIK